MSRAEYVKCVRLNKDKSWCGRYINSEVIFLSIDHAVLNGFNLGRLVACPACRLKIKLCLDHHLKNNSDKIEKWKEDL